MTFDASTARQTFTEIEFCRLVGLSLSTVRKLRSKGRVPHLRLGRRILYTPSDVEAFLAAHRRIAVREAA
jgi:excisionase family DNA binding protein